MNLSRHLVSWYKINKRQLPFRNTRDAYKIWLSEVILQQTRVEQGLPYYHRFIEKFPDVFTLAVAGEEDVLKLWQGLGYYSRGRDLHYTAQEVVNQWEGKFPTAYNDLLSLKGIGSYTAAAIASFAFKKPYAVVDGNVMRVLSRIFAISEPVNAASGRKTLEALALELLDKAHPHLHNYAMMELGALICKPQNPICDHCPVSGYCEARKLKKQHLFPVKVNKVKIQNRYLFYLVISYKNKFYIRQRTANDIWKNLYDFPLIETPKKGTAQNLVQSKVFKDFLGGADYSLSFISKTYKHVLSHRHLYAVFIGVNLKKALPKNKSKGWKPVSREEMGTQYALPRLIDKFMQEHLV